MNKLDSFKKQLWSKTHEELCRFYSYKTNYNVPIFWIKDLSKKELIERILYKFY